MAHSAEANMLCAPPLHPQGRQPKHLMLTHYAKEDRPVRKNTQLRAFEVYLKSPSHQRDTQVEDFQWPDSLAGSVKAGTSYTTYSANTRKTLKKQLAAANRSYLFSVKCESNNFVVQCQAGLYDLVRKALLVHYLIRSNYGQECEINVQKDANGIIMQTTIKISGQGRGAVRYTINMYHTTCTLLVNGRQFQDFQSDWETAIEMIDIADANGNLKIETHNKNYLQLITQAITNNKNAQLECRPNQATSQHDSTNFPIETQTRSSGNLDSNDTRTRKAAHINAASPHHATETLAGNKPNLTMDIVSSGTSQNQMMHTIPLGASSSQAGNKPNLAMDSVSSRTNQNQMMDTIPGGASSSQAGNKPNLARELVSSGTSQNQIMDTIPLGASSNPTPKPPTLMLHNSQTVGHGETSMLDSPTDVRTPTYNAADLLSPPAVIPPRTTPVVTHQSTPPGPKSTKGPPVQFTQDVRPKTAHRLMEVQPGRSCNSGNNEAYNSLQNMEETLQRLQAELQTKEKRLNTRENALKAREKDIDRKLSQHEAAKVCITGLERKVRTLEETNRLLEQRLHQLSTQHPPTPVTELPPNTPRDGGHGKLDQVMSKIADLEQKMTNNQALQLTSTLLNQMINHMTAESTRRIQDNYYHCPDAKHDRRPLECNIHNRNLSTYDGCRSEHSDCSRSKHRRRSPSPYHRRRRYSPSPYRRGRRRSPSPYYEKKTYSRIHRRHSPGPSYAVREKRRERSHSRRRYRTDDEDGSVPNPMLHKECKGRPSFQGERDPKKYDTVDESERNRPKVHNTEGEYERHRRERNQRERPSEEPASSETADRMQQLSTETEEDELRMMLPTMNLTTTNFTDFRLPEDLPSIEQISKERMGHNEDGERVE